MEQLAIQENQPILTDNYPVFEWKPGIEISDNKSDVQEEEHIKKSCDENLIYFKFHEQWVQN